MPIVAIAINVGLLVAFFAIHQLVVRLMARRDGFRPIKHNLKRLGPVLMAYRWGSVRIGSSTRWGRTVNVTLFRSHIHLRLIKFFGGGELLIPLDYASYSFSHWIHGELVDITVNGKTYTFGQKIAEMAKKYYC